MAHRWRIGGLAGAAAAKIGEKIRIITDFVGGKCFPGSDQCGLAAEKSYIEYEYEYENEYEHATSQSFESDIVSKGQPITEFS